MIKYKLICKSCDLTFDSWFASSNEFEKLKSKNLLNCYKCDSKNIEKTLMAPQLISQLSKKEKTNNKKSDHKYIGKKVKEYQKFIQKNFKFVGQNFAYEARSIHYDNKKTNKGIYGMASDNEMKELKEEGIKTEIIPWVEDTSN
jgi:hypothetical protein